MDCNRDWQLHVTQHKGFVPCWTRPDPSPTLGTSYMLEMLGETPEERRQAHESI